MFHGFVKRWLLLAPVVFALTSFGVALIRGHLERVAAELLEHEARRLGLSIHYNDLRVGLLGVIQLEGVLLRGAEVGTVPIPRVEVAVDLASIISGEPRIDRITVFSPRIRLTSAQLGPVCEALGLCDPSRDGRGGRRLLSRGATLPRLAGGGAPTRATAPARPARIGRIEIEDLRLEVVEDGPFAAPWLALYELDVHLRAGVDRVHVSGAGHLVSVFATTPNVPIVFHGDVGPEQLGFVVDVDGGLALAAPGATLSFEQVGLRLGEHSEAWLNSVVVLPDLIDFTEAWRAESVSAVLSMRSGPLPESVLVDGLKGELDLLALSDFFGWLATPPDPPGDPDERALDELRTALVAALRDVRGGLLGLDLNVQASDGQVQVRYPDGTTFELAELKVRLGANDDGAESASVAFRGLADASETSPARHKWGRVEVLVRHLTAAGIATWMR